MFTNTSSQRNNRSRIVHERICYAMKPPPTLPRALYLPPPGRPRWVCPGGLNIELQYLGWGKRRFSTSPIPVSLHHGWVYILVLHGRPILRMVHASLDTQPGQMLIIGPDCASGWKGEMNDGLADLLIWVWHGPPRCAELRPASDDYATFNVDGAVTHLLRQIHASCRREVGKPDAFTSVALDACRSRIDVALARALRPSAAAPEPAMRLEFALRWLAQNIAERRPVAALSDYLQVSPVTLNRLFKTHLMESVASYYTRTRMDQARRLLESGQVTIKEAAYMFGYGHANDFSRAFAKFTGHNPSELQNAGKD